MSSKPDVPMNEIQPPVLRTVIVGVATIGKILRSKDVTEHPRVRGAHTALSDRPSFNPVAARAMRRHAAELGIVFVGTGSARTGGAYWRRTA